MIKASLLMTVLLFVFLFSASITASAQEKITDNTYRWKQEENKTGITAGLFKLMEGAWIGEGLGGQCEEYWSPMKDSLMIGMFRFVENEKTVFTEFMYLMHDSVGWLLRVKHFNPDFTGWEEKDKSVNFRLINTEPNRLLFNGLTFERKDDNTLLVFLALKGEGGKMKEEKFVFTKKK